MSKEVLQIVEDREVKGNRERERYIQLNAEFQKTAGRDKKAFLNEQCEEKEGKTEWERLEITLRKLEISREYFMQGWARSRTEIIWT